MAFIHENYINSLKKKNGKQDNSFNKIIVFTYISYFSDHKSFSALHDRFDWLYYFASCLQDFCLCLRENLFQTQKFDL